MEKAINIAAALYKKRSTAKKFWGDEYQERVDPFIIMLKADMQKSKQDTLPTLIEILQNEEKTAPEIAKLMYCCAALEIIENP